MKQLEKLTERFEYSVTLPNLVKMLERIKGMVAEYFNRLV